MSFTIADILNALSTVEDPDLKRDLVSLNMIKDVKVEPQKVSNTFRSWAAKIAGHSIEEYAFENTHIKNIQQGIRYLKT